MHYHFVEIGTSYFNTEIEKASNNCFGLSVEPIINYLNKLPNKPNVIKVNKAISVNNQQEILKVYYISDETIKKENEKTLTNLKTG